MASKDEVARRIADSHYLIESTVTQVFRLIGSPQAESDPEEPIKLLEVNEATIPAGIMPLGFGAHPESGIEYSSVIVEVTPEEYEGIIDGRLPLPNDWQLGDLFPRPLEPEKIAT